MKKKKVWKYRFATVTWNISKKGFVLDKVGETKDRWKKL